MSKKHLAALPLGGVGIIGMNMMVYECDGSYIVVDAGVSFPDETCPGVNAVIPDTRFLREHAKHIKAFFLTHAHEDHVGGLGYVWDDLGGAPVHASPFGMEVVRSKLSELGIRPEKGQLITTTVREEYTAGPFKVEYVPVSHSIPEAFGLAIKTPYGTIMHTGDYKFDEAAPFGQKTDEKRLGELGNEGVLAVFGDSTNAMKPTESGSEAPVIEHLSEVIKNTKGRVVFAAFASHIGRTLQLAEVAAAQGRKICFLGRTIGKMTGHAKTLGFYPNSLKNWVVDAEEMSSLADDKVFIFASGTQGEGGSSLTRLSQGNDVRGIKLKPADTVILSSRMIPGNERAILNVINGLSEIGVKVISELNDEKIHVSGHGGIPEITRMYNLLKPKYVVPVHGEPMHLRAHGELAKKLGSQPLKLRTGQKLVLAERAEDGSISDKKPYVQSHSYPHGLNYIDGLNILDHDPVVLKDRRKLAYEGVVVAAVALRKNNGEILSDVSVTSRGLIDERLQADLLKACSTNSMKMLEKLYADGIVDDRNQASEAIQQVVRKLFRQIRGKQPTVLVQFVEV